MYPGFHFGAKTAFHCQDEKKNCVIATQIGGVLTKSVSLRSLLNVANMPLLYSPCLSVGLSSRHIREAVIGYS